MNAEQDRQLRAAGCGCGHCVALVQFDDPRAQSAVDQYLSKEAARFSREEKAKGIGPLGSWPP